MVTTEAAAGHAGGAGTCGGIAASSARPGSCSGGRLPGAAKVLIDVGLRLRVPAGISITM